MSKKTASAMILAVLFSLLLTGCQDLPTSLEDIIGWREKFLLPLTVEQIQFFVGDILFAIVVFAGIRGLFGHLHDSVDKIPFAEGRLSAALMHISAAALIYSLIPTANLLTQNLMPADLTIDKLLSDLHLDLLTIDPLKMITQVWAVSFSITLPLLVEYCLLSSLVFALAVLIISAIWQLSKSLWVIISIWIGHIFFVKTFVMVETTLGNTHPAWKLADVGNNSAGFYVGFTLIVMAFCYFVIPMIGLFFGPDLVGPRRGRHNQKDREKKPRKKVDIDEIIPILIPTSHPPPQQPSPSSDTSPKNADDDDVVDADWRPVPKGELGPGPKYLPDGLPPSDDNPDTGGHPASPKPPPPSGSGNPPDPDWVPPIESKEPPKSNSRTDKSDHRTPTTPPESPEDQIITVTPTRVTPPRSAKIGKAKKVVNDLAAVTKVGAAALGQPEVAAAAQTVQSTSNVVLGALESREKSKEKPSPGPSDPDWVPTIVVNTSRRS